MNSAQTDLIPLLACADIEAEHDYLVEVLGFTSAGLERAPDGRVVHAEVRLGSRRVWLHRVDPGANLQPPGRGSAGGGIVVHIPDVDERFARVRAAGAEILSEPADQDYGQREFGIRDPEGHLWWIATPTTPPSLLE
ncbi:MAG TPA: VOC family protein [Candidatus Angelobacter sp.]|nr:VOC family protein [Candidatus Angelobacter sp.]